MDGTAEADVARPKPTPGDSDRGRFRRFFVKPSNLTGCAAKTRSCKMFGTAANEIAFAQLEHGGRLASISPLTSVGETTGGTVKLL